MVVQDPVHPFVARGERVDVEFCGEDGLVVGDAEVRWVGPVEV